MDVRIEHLGDGAGIGAAFSFVFQLVRAIHMARWEHWSFPERPASDSELMGRRDWGRVVSVNTHDLKGPNLRIHDANLHSTTAAALPWPLLNCPSDTPVQLLTIDVDGTGSDIAEAAIAIAFDAVKISRDGSPITVEAFAALGETYWQKWQQRHKTNP